MGRPSLKSEAVITEICERLSRGEPLAAICRDAHMPATHTVYDWLAADESFSAQYARARAEGYDVIAIATREVARGRGESSGDVARDKLIIETDMRLLKCWDPKRYGDRVDVGVSGGITVNLESRDDRI